MLYLDIKRKKVTRDWTVAIILFLAIVLGIILGTYLAWGYKEFPDEVRREQPIQSLPVQPSGGEH